MIERQELLRHTKAFFELLRMYYVGSWRQVSHSTSPLTESPQRAAGSTFTFYQWPMAPSCYEEIQLGTACSCSVSHGDAHVVQG